MKYRSISVTKEFSFDAAHNLENYHGKCESLHGHTWKAQVTITAPLDNDGMVRDFSEMKNIINKHIKGKLDHSYLNETIKQPTAENIGLWIYEQLSPNISDISEITVYESPTSFSTIKF
ncbi:MAG: 6-carboxytetrahydropterin synthase QueD [Candidatus Aureabacteria bacterium]|nr:6-carboxytetrahydropterin synthase QueD [Candidatus Auribacterota bacterium]